MPSPQHAATTKDHIPMSHVPRIAAWGLRSAVLLTMLLLVVATAGRASAQGTVVERSSHIYAMAEGEVCGDICSTVSLDVGPDKSHESTVLCLQVTTPVKDDLVTYESGCADVGATFSMDADTLSWAELAPTAVALEGWTCDAKENCEPAPARTVSLGASWTGTGELDRQHSRLGNPAGPCTSYDLVDSSFRLASVAVTLDASGGTAGGNLQYLETTRITRSASCG